MSWSLSGVQTDRQTGTSERRCQQHTALPIRGVAVRFPRPVLGGAASSSASLSAAPAAARELRARRALALPRARGVRPPVAVIASAPSSLSTSSSTPARARVGRGTGGCGCSSTGGSRQMLVLVCVWVGVHALYVGAGSALMAGATTTAAVTCSISTGKPLCLHQTTHLALGCQYTHQACSGDSSSLRRGSTRHPLHRRHLGVNLLIREQSSVHLSGRSRCS